MDEGIRAWVGVAGSVIASVGSTMEMDPLWQYGLLGTAFLILVLGTWPYLTRWIPFWVPGGYRFPRTGEIEVHTEPMGEAVGRPYSIVLELPNPGRTDIWDVRALEVSGSDQEVSPAWYGTWRGMDTQEKTVHKGDSAYLELGEWSSMGVGWHSEDETWRPGKLTLSASTGSIPVFVNREGAGSHTEILQRRLRIVIRLLSHDTGRMQKYSINVRTEPGQSQGRPEVTIERVE